MSKIRKAIIKWLLGADWEEYWELHRKYTDELSLNLNLLNQKGLLLNRLIEKNTKMLEVLERDQRIIQDNKSLYEICKANEIEVQKDDYFSLN